MYIEVYALILPNLNFLGLCDEHAIDLLVLLHYFIQLLDVLLQLTVASIKFYYVCMYVQV